MTQTRFAPCPKCNRNLKATGEFHVDGRRHDTYQCDECLVTADVFGEPVELQLTFCVDDAGRVSMIESHLPS
jgi:hypothetical protein